MIRPDGKAKDGVSFVDLLAILFIGLKLTGHIDWSWWWVLSPIWVVFITAFVYMFVVALGKNKQS